MNRRLQLLQRFVTMEASENGPTFAWDDSGLTSIGFQIKL